MNIDNKREENECGFYLIKKKRFCKMKTFYGNKFCPHHSHLDLDEEGNPGLRIPCPYDPSHYCYKTKLDKHLKKCNAREKEKPIYFIKNINAQEVKSHDKISLQDIDDDELLTVIKKIENEYDENNFVVIENCRNHPLLQQEINKLDDGIASLKHIKQQASLLGIMAHHEFLSQGRCFIEFGAGKGQLMYWIVNSVPRKEENTYLLIDKSAQRHKSDTKFKGSSLEVERLRIDIQDLYLGKIEKVQKHINKVVCVSKHLCGAANDLAIKCMMETLQKEEKGQVVSYKPLGLVMALCCYHRCSWITYIGKEFLESKGFTEKDFKILCCITSWATCGYKPSHSKKLKTDHVLEGNENKQLNRYEKLNIKHKDREKIGLKSKRLIDMGRIHYLQKHGYVTNLYTYVNSSISLENIALVAILKM